ncbi:MAG: hypothetical protein IJ702_02640 [Fretibacterium sp.]|nr:hypothetical protein [Fretibacterium sp.]
MSMSLICENLYQFTTYVPPMDFTLHQYLLAAEPAVLFAAGTVPQARAALPQMREVLNGRPLKYVFVSHMESDESGGLPVLLEAWPELTVLCSALGARELPGWGYEGQVRVSGPDAPLQDGALSLRFFDYPSEVHLQDGLVCLEGRSGIFYSADLMLRFGNAGGKVIEGSWQDEVAGISPERVPNEARRQKLQEALLSASPKLIAPGHGFCVRLHGA